MSRKENEFRVRPGRSRDSGKAAGRKAQRLATLVKRAANRAGYTRSLGTGPLRGNSSGNSGRGRHALVAMHRNNFQRRVTVMARIVRHKGARFRGAPLGQHISYLERDGVTRDGRDAAMFDGEGDQADRDAFAGRCENDRHHFRFIVSPEDAGALGDLRSLTRDLMGDMSKDLGTGLDWVAVDHWNTDNPHVHILLRGVADDGTDLVIDRGYVSEGIRFRAEQRVTLELGMRSEMQIETALAKEVDAEYWTSLDRILQQRGDEAAGLIDLRPDPDSDSQMERHLRGRMATLETLGLAARQSSGIWTMEADAQATLRDLAVRNDIIKTMHRALGRDPHHFSASDIALHHELPETLIVGRLVERGFHDELAGTAYAIVDGIDGRAHHLRFEDLEMTGDAQRGSIVELRSWEDRQGNIRLSLATRSDLPLDAQVTARGATWLDRQFVARKSDASGKGFGQAVRNAIEERASFLASQDLARRQGNTWIPASGLIDTLKTRELGETAQSLCARTGLPHLPVRPGDELNGTYRERISLSSGRFAMIDNGLGFQLVPWRPALDRHLGQTVAGTISPGGSVDWHPGRSKGIGL